MNVTDLTTERLVVKPHTLANADRLHVWQNDFDLLYFNSDEVEPRSKERVVESLEHWIHSTSTEVLHRAIHLRAGGEFIGFCQLAFDSVHRRCKLGITNGEKLHWGSGYGKEVVHALVSSRVMGSSTSTFMRFWQVNTVQC
jgi:RimJ/RimL family protein N-acetyltransferase